MSKNVYFAKDEPKKTIQYLEDKAKTWYDIMQSNNYIEKMVTSWAYYYGKFYDAEHEITFGGESGELLHIPIGHFGNIGQHILNNVTGSRPGFQCRAVNTDRKSMVQADLGNSILNYYARERRFERKWKKAAEYAIVMGSGFILTEWNSTKGGISGYLEIDEDKIADYDEEGNPLDQDGYILEKTPIFRGDVEMRTVSPLDVIFDFSKDDPELNDWYLVRLYMNKYDLAAKYPEKRDEILAIDSDLKQKRITLAPHDQTTDIPTYHFFHRGTESMPEGRYLMYLNSEIELQDTALPYPDLPVQRVSARDILGSSFGYTTLFDLIPIQDAINSAYSTVLTNHNAFGVQNILNPTGNGVEFSQVSDGMNWIDYDPEVGPPTSLQLTKSSSESYQIINVLEKVMETISGINSVARGNPEASLKSGTALALIQSQAVQFMSGLQGNYIQLLEDSATFVINLLKEFADEPRVIAITGVSNTSRMKEFNNVDITDINRVVVDVGSALLNTTAGRWQVAENLIQMGLIKTPEKVLELLTTGSLKNMTEGITNELDVIRAENEALINDEPIIAISLDEHAMHIREHKAVLSDPKLRFDKGLVDRTLNHIMEHMTLLRETDPSLLAVVGQQPVGPEGGSPNAPQQNPTAAGADDMSNSMAEQDPSIPAGTPKPAQPPGEFKDLPQTPQELMLQQGQ